MADQALDRPMSAPRSLPSGIGRWVRLRQSMAAYALCAPAVSLMIALLVGPILAVLALSLTDYQLGAKSLAFVGLENYALPICSPTGCSGSRSPTR